MGSQQVDEQEVGTRFDHECGDDGGAAGRDADCSALEGGPGHQYARWPVDTRTGRGCEGGGYLHTTNNGTTWTSLDPNFTNPASVNPLGRSIDAAVAAIKEFPGTTLQTVEGSNIKVDIKTDENGLANMNSYLVSKGIRVCGFSEQKTDLEDLFMEAVGGSGAAHEAGARMNGGRP